jgi:hypothetical protein
LLHIRNLVCGALGSLMLGAVCPASWGAITELGQVELGVATVFGGGSSTSTLSDIFLFSVPVNNGSGYTVTNFSPPFVPGAYNTNLTSLSIYDNPDGIPDSADDVLLGTVAGPGSSLDLMLGESPARSMFIKVTGTTTGSLGGFYIGAISVTPVPEPSTWTMIAAGVMLLGFRSVARRVRSPLEMPGRGRSRRPASVHFS